MLFKIVFQCDDIEHQNPIQLNYNKNNSNSGRNNYGNNETWFSTDEMYQMTFTTFNEELWEEWELENTYFLQQQKYL